MLLNAPTVQIVVFANFIALAVAWSFVVRSYPDLNAARFWQASAFVAALGAGATLLRLWIDPLAPILIGNTALIVASWLAWAGLRQFYGRAIPWRTGLAIIAAFLGVLAFFKLADDMIAIRVLIVSSTQCTVMALMLRELRGRHATARSPGADLSRAMIITMMASEALRAASALAGLGGPISPVSFNGTQAAGFLVLLFAGLMVNFGFVLMAIDRLRADVAALALVDELTGVANRRHFLIDLENACVRAARLNEALSLLVVDLDGFKAINDGYGHGAGDICLRTFTLAAQARLRGTDLLARTGGDEFCVILPATTLNEAALVARDLVKTCRKVRAEWDGAPIPMTVSIGVATWSPEMKNDYQQLITAADQALYIAKKQGRDRLALPETAEPLRMTA
jgi:diguanylate cyclase (GGDEF)-like protein